MDHVLNETGGRKRHEGERERKMSIRYRKVISIFNWLRINISKTGMSISLGPKGRSVNFNKNGFIGNLQLPFGLRLQKYFGRRHN